MNMKTMGRTRPALFLTLMLIVSVSLTGCEVVEGLLKIFEGVKMIGSAIFGGGSKTSSSTKANAEKSDTGNEVNETDLKEADLKEADLKEIVETDDEQEKSSRQNTPGKDETAE